LAAVDGVDLELESGSSLALVGESGSGKSTIARLILRLLPPTAGSIRFLDRDLLALTGRELRATRRQLQGVSQDPYGSLDPRLTIGDSIAEPLVVHRLAPARERLERVGSLLAEVGLGEVPAGRYPHELSGGQRQRVAVARALATDPKLLVADEPASALDAPVRSRLLDLLDDRRRARGLAILLIAHDFESVRRVAERVAVIRRGRVVETGPVADVLAAPRHPYTAALVAAARLGANRHARQSVRMGEDRVDGGPMAPGVPGSS
jgi:ABC-type glutathione transport system ATPase component